MCQIHQIRRLPVGLRFTHGALGDAVAVGGKLFFGGSGEQLVGYDAYQERYGGGP